MRAAGPGRTPTAGLWEGPKPARRFPQARFATVCAKLTMPVAARSPPSQLRLPQGSALDRGVCRQTHLFLTVLRAGPPGATLTHVGGAHAPASVLRGRRSHPGAHPGNPVPPTRLRKARLLTITARVRAVAHESGGHTCSSPGTTEEVPTSPQQREGGASSSFGRVLGTVEPEANARASDRAIGRTPRGVKSAGRSSQGTEAGSGNFAAEKPQTPGHRAVRMTQRAPGHDAPKWGPGRASARPPGNSRRAQAGTRTSPWPMPPNVLRTRLRPRGRPKRHRTRLCPGSGPGPEKERRAGCRDRSPGRCCRGATVGHVRLPSRFVTYFVSNDFRVKSWTIKPLKQRSSLVL